MKLGVIDADILEFDWLSWFNGPVNPLGSCRAWSVYLTTLFLDRLSPVLVQFHLPENDNCPSSISRRDPERVTAENISGSISAKECCQTPQDKIILRTFLGIASSKRFKRVPTRYVFFINFLPNSPLYIWIQDFPGRIKQVSVFPRIYFFWEYNTLNKQANANPRNQYIFIWQCNAS